MSEDEGERAASEHGEHGEHRMIVTTTPTIQDGQVLRWYPTLEHARARDPIASVSRNRIQLDGTLAEIEPILDDLRRAHARLARGEDVTDLATHRPPVGLGDPQPIVRPGAEVSDV